MVSVWPAWRRRASSSENSRGLRSTVAPLTVTRREASSRTMAPARSFGSARRRAGLGSPGEGPQACGDLLA